MRLSIPTGMVKSEVHKMPLFRKSLIEGTEAVEKFGYAIHHVMNKIFCSKFNPCLPILHYLKIKTSLKLTA